MTSFIVEEVEAADVLAAWVIKDKDAVIGAAWTDEDSDEVFFHVRFTDGKALGKAEVLKQLIPVDSWMLIPPTMPTAAKYLERYVGLTVHEPIYHAGEVYLPLKREADE
jgi:hypothetical protein